MKRNTQQPTVTFQNPNVSPSAAEQEETLYSEVKVRNKTSKQSTKTNAEKEEEPVYSQVHKKTSKQSANTSAEEEEPVCSKVKERNQTSELSADTNASLITDKNDKSRRPPCLLVAAFLAIVCVMLIAAIIAVCILLLPLNHDRELELLKENQTALLEEKHNLTDDNNRLSSANQNLTQNLNNLTIRVENLTEAFDLSELRVTDLMTKNHQLTTKNKNLTTENQGLKTENKQLETQNNNLKQQIQGRECQPCQTGWTPKASSCYAVNNPPSAGQKTWTEARGDCAGKRSDLVVIADEAEKTAVSEASFGSSGFWIGLRVEGEKWKWVDGSDLNKGLWTEPAVEGHCAILFKNQTWRSVRCSDKNQWICEQAALLV